MYIFIVAAVLEVAHNTGTFGQRSVKVVGNDIFYLTLSGLATLSTVTQYGDIKTSWPDRKVSRALTPLINENAQLWDIPVKQQLWILPSELEKRIWVFDYTRGIWTQFEFYDAPVYAVGVDNRLYVFIDENLYEVNDYYTQDDKENVVRLPIQGKMKLGTILSVGQTLIKAAYASFEIMPDCNAVLKLGKFELPFKSGYTEDYIYDSPNDVQAAYEDDDPLFSGGELMTARRRCIVRDWSITPEIEFSGGCSSISTLGLEKVNV